MNIRHLKDNLFLVTLEDGSTSQWACRATSVEEAEAEILAGMEELAGPAKPTADDIKAEASRRILAIAPEWRQRNALARALQLQERLNAGETLTPDQEAERQALHALWASINAIRARSDELEQTLPDDYMDDARWP